MMDERDTTILFGYLERMTKAVEKIAKQLELSNLPAVITCDNSCINSDHVDFSSLIRVGEAVIPEQRNEEIK